MALLEDRRPDASAFDLCRDLRSWMSKLQCIIFTSFGSRNELWDAIQAGASGCIIRNARGFEVLAAIKGAAARDFLFETTAATAYLANRAREDFIGAFSWTEQEGELLRLITAGHTDSPATSRILVEENAFRTSPAATAALGGPGPTP